jgi:hypothetical protein
VNRYAIEVCLNMKQKLDYINNHLQDHDFIIYDNKLTMLKSLGEVKLYAIKIVTSLCTDFDKLPLPKTWMTHTKEFPTNIITSKWFWGAVGFSILCFGIYNYKFVDHFTNIGSEGVKPILQNVATLGQETVQLAAANQESLGNVTQASSDLINYIKNIVPPFIKESFAKELTTQQSFIKMQKSLEGSVTVLDVLTDKIILHEYKINDLINILIKIHPKYQETLQLLLFKLNPKNGLV